MKDRCCEKGNTALPPIGFSEDHSRSHEESTEPLSGLASSTWCHEKQTQFMDCRRNIQMSFVSCFCLNADFSASQTSPPPHPPPMLLYWLNCVAVSAEGLMNYYFHAVIGAINGYSSGKGYHKHICLLLVSARRRGRNDSQPYHLLKLSVWMHRNGGRRPLTRFWENLETPGGVIFGGFLWFHAHFSVSSNKTPCFSVKRGHRWRTFSVRFGFLLAWFMLQITFCSSFYTCILATFDIWRSASFKGK